MTALEDTLTRLIEHAREELSIVRKRNEERTPAGSHGHDYERMRDAADRVDHLAHDLRRLHDGEFPSSWRKRSAED